MKTNLDNLKVNLENQQTVLDDRRKEVERMKDRARYAGARADSAPRRPKKNSMSLHDEAKTAAASYINDIMDDAKLTANKEAKRIIVETIQRFATETAIENAGDGVSHRERRNQRSHHRPRGGRNIRAL